MKFIVGVFCLGFLATITINAHTQTAGDIMRDAADCSDAYHADKGDGVDARYLRCMARVRDEEDAAEQGRNTHREQPSQPTPTTSQEWAAKALDLFNACDPSTIACGGLIKANACHADSSLCGIDDMGVLRAKLNKLDPQPTDDDLKAWAKKVEECHCDVPMPTASNPASKSASVPAQPQNTNNANGQQTQPNLVNNLFATAVKPVNGKCPKGYVPNGSLCTVATLTPPHDDNYFNWSTSPSVRLGSGQFYRDLADCQDDYEAGSSGYLRCIGRVQDNLDDGTYDDPN